MDFKLGRINLNAVAQGVGGLVFGNENSSSAEDSYVERYLDRISNGVLAEDRRAAMNELQTLVAESRSAQLAFGATGLPILMKVLREERDDVEMIRGALETLVGALTPIDTSHGQKNEVQPASMNSDLLSREPESISHLLSLLSEDDFYIRYYTLQLLTALLTHSPSRLQEAILSTPRGVTRLVDMLMDREVIRNEALLLLTHLTREAEEIQKILVFEGVFEKIFSIIKEEGGSEGGVVVQDCLELLNNLIRKNASNQVLLKETIGFEPLISVLKLHRGSAYNFTQQKTINLLSALDTVELLLMGGVDGEPGKNGNRLANQSVLGQKKILDYLLMLGVESQWASLSVRCSALRCIGTLIYLNPQNLDMLANKFVGEEPHIEPALNSILRIILRTSTVQEFVAADHVFKCFCEKNKDGQTMLASSMTSQPNSSHQPSLDSNNLSFGSMLLHGLIFNDNDGDLEASCRAASVLFHILKDNSQCKERVLRIVLEVPVPSLGSPEPLLHRIVKYLALTSSKSSIEESANEPGGSYKETLFLRLLVAWLADCPASVDCFLDSPAHLTYMLELLTNSSSSAYVRGLTSVILGECVLYNKKSEGNRDAFAVVDAISQKIGLASYFMNFDELQKIFAHTSSTLLGHHRPVTRSSAASISDMEDRENEARAKQEQHPIFTVVFDHQFVDMIKKLELEIRESIVDVFSHPKNTVAVVPAELEQKNGEPDGDYIKRLKLFVQKQCTELQELLGRNATLAEDLARNGVARDSDSSYKPGSGNEKVQSEMLRRDIKEATERAETLKAENAKLEAQATMYKNLAAKTESDLKSLSDAYNSLEHANFRLESELKISRKGGSESYPDVEAIRAEAREEAQKESEAELNDLLVCLGQEQSKVERLSARLAELGEDVDSLLEGIGDEAGLPEEFDDADEN